MSKITVVVGGQFGSEAKGAIAAHIAHVTVDEMYGVIGVRVGGPNAGHTVYGFCPEGCSGLHSRSQHPWRLRHVPVSMVSSIGTPAVIAAGSEIDPGVLESEVRALDSAGYAASERLHVDLNATYIDDAHKSAEAEMGLTDRLGSTAKGIGAARAERLMRKAMTVEGDRGRIAHLFVEPSRHIHDTADYLQIELYHNPRMHVVVEGTQGYGLGLHTAYYPFTTSGDCRAIDFLAQAGISPWMDGVQTEVVVVARTYPIRVAGNSGPLYRETSWEEIGQPQELTTVTGKVRRVGRWNPYLLMAALMANGAPTPNVSLALTMADYVVPSIAGSTGLDDLGQDHAVSLLNLVEAAENSVNRIAEICYIGTSPTSVWSPDAVRKLRSVAGWKHLL